MWRFGGRRGGGGGGNWRGGSRGASSGGAAGSASASAGSASSSGAKESAGGGGGGGVEEEFASWYERRWPMAPAASSSSSAAAATPARQPGLGTAGPSASALPAAADSCLKVFQKRSGEYYTCYGNDALRVADEFFKTRDVLKFIPLPSAPACSPRGLPALSLSPKKLLTILQAVVLTRGDNLEIWSKTATRGGRGGGAASGVDAAAADEEEGAEEGGGAAAAADEDGEEERSGGGGSSGGEIGWHCLRRATPGNLDGLEELLGFQLSSGSSSVSVAIKLSWDQSTGGFAIGLAFVDPAQRTARVLELHAPLDDATLGGLEGALVAQGASQAFLLAGGSGGGGPQSLPWKRVAHILSDCHVPVQQARGSKGGVSQARPAVPVAVAPEEDGSDAGAAAAELQSLSSGAGASALGLSDLQELSRYFSPSSPLSLLSPGAAASLRHALSALQFLLRALSVPLPDQHQPSSRFVLDRLRVDDHVRLDQAAFTALTLFPRAEDTDRNMSLYGVLNHARTAMGSKMIAAFIRQPLTSRDHIVVRQDYVELFYLDTELRDRLRSQLLRGIPDLQRLSLRFQKGQARGSGSRGDGTAKGGPGLDEVMAFFRLAVAQGPRICEALEEFADSHPEHHSSVAVEPEATAAAASASGPAGGPLARPVLARLRADFIAPLQTHLASLSPFVAMVEQAVLVSEQVGYNGQVRVAYSINPLIHPRLEEIAAAQSAAKVAVDAEAAAIQSAVSAASNQAVQPKLAHSDAHGFHLRLTKTEERKFSRGEGMGLGVGAVRLIESRKDGLHFSTRRLEKLAHAHAQLSADFAAASQQLLGDVVATTATYTPVLDALAGIVAALDTFSTLAHVAAAASQPWVRPTMLPMGSGRIEIKQARHACMEHSCATASGGGGGGQFIPNDASMLRGESHLQIITGPNMGGKSSYCRSIALNLLLAQTGSFIPAQSGSLTCVDAILARVGAGDSTQRGQSTFMTEMLEAASILRQASPHSLVLIDELGRGTSVDEGFGLAFAIAEHLAARIACFTFFATHFHEVTQLEHEIKGVVNRHVCVHESGGSLTMLYALAAGPADRSYGVHVARLAHFPEQIVRDAIATAKELESFGRARTHTDAAVADHAAAPAPVAPSLSADQQRLLDAFELCFADAAADGGVEAEAEADGAALRQRLAAFQQEHQSLIQSAIEENSQRISVKQEPAAEQQQQQQQQQSTQPDAMDLSA